jgi:hypothetical protein
MESLQESAGKLSKLAPFGTSLISSVTLVLFILNAITNGSVWGAFCLASDNATHGLFTYLNAILFNPLAHAGWYVLFGLSHASIQYPSIIIIHFRCMIFISAI